MSRQRLPDRRAAATVDLEHGGSRFTVTIGFYPDGRPGEVFPHGIRPGSGLDALLADACVLLSLLMQYDVEPTQIADSMGRSGNACTASLNSGLIDLAAKASPPAQTDGAAPT